MTANLIFYRRWGIQLIYTAENLTISPTLSALYPQSLLLTRHPFQYTTDYTIRHVFFDQEPCIPRPGLRPCISRQLPVDLWLWNYHSLLVNRMVPQPSEVALTILQGLLQGIVLVARQGRCLKPSRYLRQERLSLDRLQYRILLRRW